MSGTGDLASSEIHKHNRSEKRAGSLLVFADDWGRHPSSCQHLISKLLPKYQVTWVNTIGMRPPRLDHVTFKRALEKLTPWTGLRKNPPELPDNLNVIDPKMWPWFSRSHDRWLNQKMLMRGLKPIVSNLRRPLVGITTLPIVADLMGLLDVDRWIYYCVDDFSKWPGLDQQALAEMESILIQKSDRVIAASPHLQARIQEHGNSSVKLLTHGVDLQHWRRLDKLESSASNADSAGQFPWTDYASPLVVFWGLIDRRMDTETLRKLSEQMDQGTILLVGPVEHPDPEILSLENVKHISALNYEDLPKLAAAADILIMPYADLPVTQAMQPLKLKEYLCTDKPVVVRKLPAVEPWLDCLDAAETAEEFASHVIQRLTSGIPESQITARQRISQETWEAKAEEFETWTLAF